MLLACAVGGQVALPGCAASVDEADDDPAFRFQNAVSLREHGARIIDEADRGDDQDGVEAAVGECEGFRDSPCDRDASPGRAAPRTQEARVGEAASWEATRLRPAAFAV